MPTPPPPQPLPSNAWQHAASFAARAHRHHLRKDNLTPYVAHVYRVALTVRHAFSCEDPVAITAALLHDTIEDTTTDYDDLAAHFGPAVAGIVAALTKNMAMPEPQREADYDARLAAADWRARLIKLADVYDNLADARDRAALDAAHAPAIAKFIDKARRAVELASPDAAAHPETARAIALLQHAAALPL